MDAFRKGGEVSKRKDLSTAENNIKSHDPKLTPDDSNLMSTQAEQAIEKLTDYDFCKLSIDDFIAGGQLHKDLYSADGKGLQFSIYIRLSASKYLKLAEKGGGLALDRLKAYQDKGVRFLYMRKSEFQFYLGMNLELAQKTVGNSSISRQQKISLIKHTSELVLTQLYTDEIHEQAIESAQIAVETATATLADFDEAYELLTILNGHTDFLYAQSVAVSFYSALIAKELRWNSPATLLKISMAGLLRDVGKKEFDRSLLEKPRIRLKPEEIRLLETHPMRGVEILSRVASMPTDVLQIVLQHHENCLGTGYPQGLKKTQIHPLARLIAVADTFAEFVIKGPDSPGFRPIEAFDRLMKLHSYTLDPHYIMALMSVFHFDPPQEFARRYRDWRST